MQSQVKRRIVFGLTTGGLLATGGAGIAHADASAAGAGDAGTTTAGSPGILSGNTVQIPVDVPINVCGVTANVLGVLNPAAGNHCANSGGASAGGLGSQGSGGASASGSSIGSPGILSGNTVQAPVHIPVNACGDSVNVVGVGNGALGNHCRNEGGGAGTGGSSATGSSVGSPGIVSGNTVQVPVDIPVNLCGDTVNVVGVANGAKGNHCLNAGGGAGTGGSSATGTSVGSPGIGSGNTIQLPISVPVNVCGDSVNVVGVANGAEGNACANNTPTPPIGTPPPPPPGTTTGWTAPRSTPPETGSIVPAPVGTLAHTGADGLMLAPMGAALMGGGAFMYRKFKPGRSH
ncbi:hypothetical protein ABIA35_009913 [Catenulispora sp. MAP12-49]|uniref:chaplin n=1 Tax=unclassified Catenulispora TaxID=414885 RepID=UPI003515D2A4